MVATGIGGIVLFSRNVASVAQVRSLIAEIRAIAPGPIRIAVDQEGGHIARIGAPLTAFPSPMALGAIGDARLAFEVARASGLELGDLGVDVVLAPVLDVAARLASPVIGARSFGADPALVSRLGAAMIEGYLSGGVLPVAKHFPGHGRTVTDSHLAVPHVSGSFDELVAVDLPPFAAAVRAGVPALMTSHIVYAAFADPRPASLSPVATDLARGRLGFDGLLLTDALVMDAVARRRRLDLAAVDAVAAGADAVMAIEATWRCLGGLELAVADGRLAPERVRDAIGRAAAFDAMATSVGRRAGHAWAGGPGAIDWDIDGANHRALVDRVAGASLTLVTAARAPVLPIPVDARLVVVDVASSASSPIENPRDQVDALGPTVRRLFPNAVVVPVRGAHGTGWDEADAAVRRADRVIVASRDAFAGAETRHAVATFATPGSIHVALRSPVDLDLGRAATRIAAYADTPATADALAAALIAGPNAFAGRLPVELPSAETAVA